MRDFSFLKKASFLNENANAALYTLVIIPLVVSFSVLAVDISKFQAERNYLQREADRISMLAAQVLPDTASAIQIINENLKNQENNKLQYRIASNNNLPELNISTNEISITLEAEINASFGAFVKNEKGERKFIIRESSSARLVPQDTVLIIPDDISLRPMPGETWGEESFWPASNYFNFVNPPEISDQTNSENIWANWWKEWDNQSFRRWLTESCYNTVYSALKHASISLVDVLGAIRGNRLGILITPGDFPLLGYSKPLPLSYPANETQIPFSGYFETQSFISDEACVIFADEKTSASTTYQINTTPPWINKQKCAERIENSRWGERYFPNSMLSRCFIEDEYRARDAIYYRAARNNSHSQDAANIISALNEAYIELIRLKEDDIPKGKIERGNLADRAKKQIILIADKLPIINSQEMQELKDRLTAAKINLKVVSYQHQGLKIDELNELAAQTSALRQEQSWPGLKVFSATTPDELTTEAIPKLLISEREIVIAK